MAVGILILVPHVHLAHVHSLTKGEGEEDWVLTIFGLAGGWRQPVVARIIEICVQRPLQLVDVPGAVVSADIRASLHRSDAVVREQLL